MKNLYLFLLCLFCYGLSAQIQFQEDTGESFIDLEYTTVDFADVDSDGDNDVLITGENSSSYHSRLYLNDGNGNFTLDNSAPFIDVTKGDVAFEDVNGDNYPDVLITGTSTGGNEEARLYINDGNGNFTEDTTVPFNGVELGAVAFADVDGDQDADVLISGLWSTNSYRAELFINDGNGNFTEDTSVPFQESYENDVAFADVDNDNDLDVVISGGIDSGTDLYLNDGNGNFTIQEPFLNFNFIGLTASDFVTSFSGSSIDFADIDNDNDQDLIISGNNPLFGNATIIFKNNGNLEFIQDTTASLEGVSNGHVEFLDIDNDGDKDVMITGDSNTIDVVAKLYTNDGSGNFTEVSGLPFNGVFRSAFAFSDIDDDGDEDVLIAGRDGNIRKTILYKNITPCLIDSFPFFEDFESGSINCWSFSQSSQVNIDSNCGTNSGNFLQINGGNHTSETNTINVSGESSVEVKFDISNGCVEISEPGETLDVEYWDGTTWQLLESIDPVDIPQDWTTTNSYIINSGLTTDFKIRFNRLGGSEDFDDLNIDNLSVGVPPSCLKPTNITTSSITTTSVELNWTEIGTATNWDMEYGLSGFTLGSGTTVAGATKPYTLTGLSANTDYDVYIRSNCGGGDFSDWSEKESFSTLCIKDTLPFLEDFESGSISCWSFSQSSQVNIDSNCSTNSGNFLQINGGNHTTETNTIDVSGETSIEVKFDISNGCGETSDPGETLDVEYWDGTTWQLLESINPADIPEDWTTTKSYVINSGLTTDFKIRFNRLGGSEDFDDLSIDNLSVDTYISCKIPTDLTASKITGTIAELNWTESGTATNWDIEYGASGFTLGSGTTVTGVTNPYNLTGLSAETDYDVYVRANCGGGDLSDWSAVESFMTTRDFCSGDLASDSGGTNADYPNNANETITICPDNPGDKVVINFSEFSFESSGITCLDGLTIYDGDNTMTASTINPPSGTIWCWDRDDATPSGSGDLLNISIASTTASGCLTLVLTSNGSDTRDGFVASASCESTVYLWDGGSWTNQPVGSISANDNLYVNSGGTPSITNSISAKDFYIDPNATLDASSGNISVNGDLSNHGSISGSSDVVMSGSAAQSIKGTGSITNLTVNNGNSVSVDGEQDITNMLTLTSGNLITNANLTLKSNASGTAQIDNLNGNTITGDVTVERFVPAGDNNRRVFRLLASPANSTGTIRDNWQEGASNNTDNPNPGFGTHITGSTVDGDNGFDGTVSGETSLKVFDNATQTWSDIDNTDNTSLEAGHGYALFVRGDRSVDLTSSSQTPTNTILRATGDLVTNNFDVSSDLATGVGEYSLVGNPYQSIIDINDLNTTNLVPGFYWAWDPNINLNGGYVPIELPLGTNLIGSAANNFIMPGQSFFVRNLLPNPTLEFTESAKNVSATATTIFSTNSEPKIDIKLFDDQGFTNANMPIDAIGIRFKANGNNAVNFDDAPKLPNPDDNFARQDNNDFLSIENRALPVDGEELDLAIWNHQYNNYTFEINVLNFGSEMDVFLIDNYLDNEMLLENGQNLLSFTVDSYIPASLDLNRFSLKFDNTTLGVNDNDLTSSFDLYPNPTKNGLFSIKTQNLNTDNIEIRILNLMGKQVMKQIHEAESSGEINIDASTLSSGVYMVKITQNNRSFTAKLIIQ